MTLRPVRAAGPAALLVLCALGTLASGQVQGPGRADLEIAAIDLFAPEGPAWIHGVPTAPMEVRVKVANDGNLASAGYRIDYQWIKNGQATWLNGNEEASFGVGGSLDHDDHRWDDLKWTLQPGQEGTGAIRVTLRPTGPDQDANNDVGSHGLKIPAHWVVLDVTGPAQTIHDPQETAYARIHLRNLGNTEEAVQLAIRGTDDGDAARLTEAIESTQLTVPPQSLVSTTLFVDYEFTGVTVALAPFSVQYGIQAKTAYGWSLEAATPAFSSSAEALPPGSPATLQRSGTAPLEADPGGLLMLPLRLTNTGSSSDTYLIGTSLAGSGWTAAAPRPRIALDPGESASFQVQLGALADADRGSNSTLRVHYQSARDATLDRPAPFLKIPLRIHGPSVLLSAGADWPGNPYLGDTVTLPVQVSNVGDQPTPLGATVRLRIEGAWHEAKSLPAPVVAPGEHAVLRFPIESLHPGAAVVLADWTASDPRIAKQGMTHQVLVHKPALTLTAPAGLDGVPGGVVGYRALDRSFSVRNDGNAPETLRLDLASDFGNASILLDSLELALAPQERRSIPFEHRLPLPAGNATKVEARLAVSIAGRDDLVWRANVTTSINDTRPPALRLLGPLPTEWALGEPFPLAAEASDDSAVARVAWNHTAPGGSPTVRDLAPTARADRWEGAVPLEVPGLHHITVRADDARGHAATLALPAINVSAIPPPTLRLADVPKGEVDAGHVFSVRVEDVRPISSVSLQVFDKAGAALAAKDLALDENGSASFDLRDVPAGPLSLVLQARNAAGARAELTQPVVLRSPPAAPADGEQAKETPAPSALWLLAMLAMMARRRPPGRPTRVLQG